MAMLEIKNIVNFSASETVYALVVVTHHAKVSVCPRKYIYEPVLHLICVLVFVDKYIPE